MTPALHIVNVDAARDLVSAATCDGFVVWHARFEGQDEHDAAAELASCLRFPDWAGRNWDAVEDCLTDLSWLPPTPRLLILDGLPGSALRAPAWADMVVELAATAVRWWAFTATPLTVVVVPAVAPPA